MSYKKYIFPFAASFIILFSSCHKIEKTEPVGKVISEEAVDHQQQIQNTDDVLTSTNVRIFFFEDNDEQMYYVDRSFQLKKDAELHLCLLKYSRHQSSVGVLNTYLERTMP